MLRVTHIGHAPLEVEVDVPPGGQMTLNVALRLRPVSLPGVTAQAGRAPGVRDTVEVTPAALGEASVRALESSPGMVEIGLANVVEGTSGQNPIDPSDVLFVRGAAADLKRVLLDGAPVYAPFHLGGLVAPFEADLLSSARLYVGGAPARYDGGISYILYMQTRGPRGDGVHSEIDVDLLSARTRIEGPLGDSAGYLVSGRIVHGLGASGFHVGAFPYGYADGLVRLDRRVLGRGMITATGFANRESVRLEAAEADRGVAYWGNYAGSVRYVGPIGGADAELTLGAGRFDAGLPIVGQQDLWSEGAATRVHMAADFTRVAGATAEVGYGFSFERQWLGYHAWSRGPDPDSLLRENRLTGDVSGGYFDASWQMLPRVRVRGGVRLDIFSADHVPYIAPRLLATWLLSDDAALTLAVGRYHQYVRTPESVITAPDASDSASTPSYGPNPLLAVAGASHIVLSLDQQITSGVRLGLEGFHKIYDGVPTDPDGRAQSSGLDFWIRRNRGTIQGWLGYSLAWIWSNDPTKRPVDEIFSGRHLVSAGVLGPAGDAGRFELRATYGAGLPFTAIQPGANPPAQPAGGGDIAPPRGNVVASSQLVSTPDQPYLRLDGEVTHTWLVHWMGSPMLLTPYLRVLNALNRRDALFYHFDGSQEAAPQALAALPIVPVLGVGIQF